MYCKSQMLNGSVALRLNHIMSKKMSRYRTCSTPAMQDKGAPVTWRLYSNVHLGNQIHFGLPDRTASPTSRGTRNILKPNNMASWQEHPVVPFLYFDADFASPARSHLPGMYWPQAHIRRTDKTSTLCVAHDTVQPVGGYRSKLNLAALTDNVWWGYQ